MSNAKKGKIEFIFLHWQKNEYLQSCIVVLYKHTLVGLCTFCQKMDNSFSASTEQLPPMQPRTFYQVIRFYCAISDSHLVDADRGDAEGYHHSLYHLGLFDERAKALEFARDILYNYGVSRKLIKEHMGGNKEDWQVVPAEWNSYNEKVGTIDLHGCTTVADHYELVKADPEEHMCYYANVYILELPFGPSLSSSSS